MTSLVKIHHAITAHGHCLSLQSVTSPRPAQGAAPDAATAGSTLTLPATLSALGQRRRSQLGTRGASTHGKYGEGRENKENNKEKPKDHLYRSVWPRTPRHRRQRGAAPSAGQR